ALGVGPAEPGRSPRREHDAGALRGGEMCAAEAGAEVVVSGEGGNLDDLASRFELLDGHVRQADVADQALRLELGEHADLFFEGRVRRGSAVQVVEVDAVQAEPAYAH